jgi:dTDP-4-dehydrorhamnose reductase
VKALITGGGGQLASDLARLLGSGARSYAHAELDITDVSAVERVLDAEQPDVVFNCAAYHNVDACEQNPELAWRTNVDAVRELAKRSPALVHLSTNYVFDGDRDLPYGEDDLPSPRSIYALTKLAGEYAALAYGRRVLAVRTAGLYGLHGSASKGGNFVTRMIVRAQDQGALSVVADQRLQPTFTADLARAIIDAVQRGVDGLVHLTSSGECSWHEFTVAIMERAQLTVPVEPIATARGEGQISRPPNGVLARPRADALGLPVLRSWEDMLDDYMAAAGLVPHRAPDDGARHDERAAT